MAVFIHEFLFRGRAPGSADEPAWQVTLASIGEDELGNPTLGTKTLNMAQAAEASWELPEIVAAINAETMAEASALRAEASALRAALDQTSENLEAALATGKSLSGQVEALAGEVAAKDVKIATLTAVKAEALVEPKPAPT